MKAAGCKFLLLVNLLCLAAPFAITAQTPEEHDSLAESYVAKGEKELAIASYKKSRALNPQNAGATEALRKLSSGSQ